MSELTRRGFIATALTGAAIPAVETMAAAQAPTAAQSNVTVESHVSFGKGGDIDLKLDIYRPPAGVVAKRLVQQFQEANVPVEFHAFEGVPHVFDSNPEFAVLSAQLADFFIDRHVLNPRTYPPFQSGARGGPRGA